jgi:hypothetical protein
MGALARDSFTANDEPVAPERHPREWKKWFLEINSAEIETIRDHVDDGDIIDVKPVNEPASHTILCVANCLFAGADRCRLTGEQTMPSMNDLMNSKHSQA